MPEVDLIVSVSQPPATRELAETLAHELELQDVPARVREHGVPAPAEGRIALVLDPGAYVAAEGEAALRDAGPRRMVAICAEPPPGADDADGLARLESFGAVFVLDGRAQVALQRRGLAPRLLRPGYSSRLDRFDPDGQRPVDVLLAADPGPRQAPYLERAAAILSGLGRTVATGAATTAAGRGEDLARAKVTLLVHPGEDPRFDWRAALDAVLAGAVVVAEHADGIAPLVPGEHLLVGAPDALPDLAEALLADPAALAATRTSAYERVRDWVPYALPVSVLRAAIVELVGEPVSLARALPG